MLDHPTPPLTGVRRHDLPRARETKTPLATNGLDPSGLGSRIDRHLADCRRHHHPLALLALAVDRVETADGQPAPTREAAAALEFGQRLRTRVRGSDQVLWQGEREFIVILPATRIEGALTVQQRLLQGLAGVYRLGTELVTVSVRIGCACYPAAGDSGSQLLAAAVAARQGGAAGSKAPS